LEEAAPELPALDNGSAFGAQAAGDDRPQ
jgi:hypothetical protein